MAVEKFPRAALMILYFLEAMPFFTTSYLIRILGVAGVVMTFALTA